MDMNNESFRKKCCFESQSIITNKIYQLNKLVKVFTILTHINSLPVINKRRKLSQI